MFFKSIFKPFLERWFPKACSFYRYLRDYWFFIHSKPYKTILGFELVGNARLDITRYVSNEVNLLTRLLKQVDIFIDVGANVGLFTLIACQQHVPVISIEPCSNNLQHLYQNLLLNRCTGVEVYPLALSDKINILPLFGGGQGGSLLKNWGGMISTYNKLVPVNTLDNLIIADRFIGKHLLIKIDVEGHEYNVLCGATAVLQMEPRPIFVIEHGLTENFEGEINPNFEKLFNLFWLYGYKAYTTEEEQRLVTPDDVNLWLALRKRTFGGINYMFRIERDTLFV